MDLWIKGHNLISKTNDVTLKDKYILSGDLLLAEYKTKERAKEVFEEIYETIKIMQKITFFKLIIHRLPKE